MDAIEDWTWLKRGDHSIWTVPNSVSMRFDLDKNRSFKSQCVIFVIPVILVKRDETGSASYWCIAHNQKDHAFF